MLELVADDSGRRRLAVLSVENCVRRCDKRIVATGSVERNRVHETVVVDEVLLDSPPIPNLVDRFLVRLAEFVSKTKKVKSNFDSR